MSRIGKIARLPEPIREELNRKLRNGAGGPQLLPWINALPEVQSVLSEHFRGQPINAQNLSDWRNGGFEDWEKKHEKTYHIKELASFAAKLATANGTSIASGAAAIASGKLLELLELSAADSTTLNLDQLGDVISSLTSLRSAEIAQQRANIDSAKLKQKDEELSLAKQRFQRDTCELFLKWSQDQRALQLAAAPLSNESKLQEMGKLMFGDLWENPSASVPPIENRKSKIENSI